jgi:uncharacterized membrane protein YkvI
MNSPSIASGFRRFLLPGFAFKGVVIGGGYATGRELAEFFLPSGPWGGVAGMAVTTALWSAICTLTFLFARKVGAYDYRAFFGALLGRYWIAFEAVYLVFLVLILAVFGAAAGAIAGAAFGLPEIAGTLALMAAIALTATFGNRAVEHLFTWASLLLYAVYALFVVFMIDRFGSQIVGTFTLGVAPSGHGWLAGGAIYAGYNVVGAVMILPMLRYLRSDRDAVVAGLVAGPLAILPALFFFVGMIAFVPAIADAKLPSDFILARLGHPAFRICYQVMIFAALLESGVGGVHALNERLAAAWESRRGHAPNRPIRGAFTVALLALCMLIADRIGLISLIANGYRALALAIILTYAVPLFTIGAWLLVRGGGRTRSDLIQETA